MDLGLVVGVVGMVGQKEEKTANGKSIQLQRLQNTGKGGVCCQGSNEINKLFQIRYMAPRRIAPTATTASRAVAAAAT